MLTHNPPFALYNGVGDGAVAMLSPARAVTHTLSPSSLSLYLSRSRSLARSLSIYRSLSLSLSLSRSLYPLSLALSLPLSLSHTLSLSLNPSIALHIGVREGTGVMLSPARTRYAFSRAKVRGVVGQHGRRGRKYNVCMGVDSRTIRAGESITPTLQVVSKGASPVVFLRQTPNPSGAV